MRHARSDDLDRIESLLSSLRTIDALTEKNRGTFYRGSRAFLHFHEHEGDIVCDVRLAGPDFDRRIVTRKKAQMALVRDVKAALSRDV
ncbi:MAG: hypothetical protein QOD30_781 [Actinomycetota bacterium]|jgi:N-acetylglutamate synthase-like GNAT family acetyltransferase|nr:hypothetical protein [Actinomycetota bacterium]